MNQPEYLPTSSAEMRALGWKELDVLLISGDAYVDSHSFGHSLLGRWLVAHGFRTGIIAQPSWENIGDITRLGCPRLFVGVSAGALDSLLAHYTAFRKKRSSDAYSPGGVIGLRPNRAAIVYTGLARQAFPGTPVVLGGIEASMRRASHYDFWSDSLRRSILLDSKADAVLYGMGEKSVLRLAQLLQKTPSRQKPADAIVRARIPGSVYAVHPDSIPAGAEELPSHEAILADPALLMRATLAIERQMLQGKTCLVQRHGGRVVVFEPPPEPLTTQEMDAVYALPFTRRAHPGYSEAIPAAVMIENSVVSHRGCGGGCAFCSLALHQGRSIQSRSVKSVLDEVKAMAARPGWHGAVSDIGGASSNMWNARCDGDRENCARTSCVFPKRCRHFRLDQEGQAALLRQVAALPGVEHVRVASGVRHDLALESEAYLKALVEEFTGGQLKVAPEHIVERVLRLMRKPPMSAWTAFLRSFDALSKDCGKEQYLVPYLMSAYPGCTDDDMEELAMWLRVRGWKPQQVQCFIPTPGTVATAMFHAKIDADGLPITVARTDAERLRQHHILLPPAGTQPETAARDIPRPKRPVGRPTSAGGKPGGRAPGRGENFRGRPGRRDSEGRDGKDFSRRPPAKGRPGKPVRQHGFSKDNPPPPFKDGSREDWNRPGEPARGKPLPPFKDGMSPPPRRQDGEDRGGGAPYRSGGSSRSGGSPYRPGGSSSRPGGFPSRSGASPYRPDGASARPGGRSAPRRDRDGGHGPSRPRPPGGGPRGNGPRGDGPRGGRPRGGGER